MKALDRNQNGVKIELIGEHWLTKNGQPVKYADLDIDDANAADHVKDDLYDLPIFDGEVAHSGTWRGFEYHQRAVLIG